MMIAMLIDAAYVGQLGIEELAAVTLTFPLMMGMMSIVMGLGIGATSVLARALGSGDTASTLRMATHVLQLAVILSLILLILGFLISESILRLISDETDLIPMAVDYIHVIVLAIPVLSIPMVGGMLLRAMGDVKVAALIMVSAAIIQIFIAPVLIFGIGEWQGLGVQGSAWAFTLSRAIVAVYAFVVFARVGFFKWSGSFSDRLATWKESIRLAIPSMTTQLIQPVSLLVLLNVIAGFGTAAVAGFGVATRVEGFTIMVYMALSSSITPVVGQNVGAMRHDRVRHAMNLAYKFCLLSSIVFALLLFAGRTGIGTLFSSDPAVIPTVSTFFAIVPLSFGFIGMGMASASAFVAHGAAFQSMTISLCRSLVFLIPAVYLGAEIAGVTGVFAAITLTNLIIGTVAVVWLRTYMRSVRRATSSQELTVAGIEARAQ